MTKRPYRQRKRAQDQAETRQRIVEAAMTLHEEVGPRATTISAIAARAGVQRLTVYRHFPDETSIFRACTAHWLALNPPPDPAQWRSLQGPERCRAAVGALYAYYRESEPMLTKSYRDVALVPALQEPMAEVGQYLDTVASDLLAALDPHAGRGGPLGLTVRHVLAFQTWQSLQQHGQDDEALADLACRWVACVPSNG